MKISANFEPIYFFFLHIQKQDFFFSKKTTTNKQKNSFPPTTKDQKVDPLWNRFLCQYHLNELLKYVGRAKRIWYLSPMRAAKVQASLRIRAVSPELPLLAHTSSESRGTFRRKARSLAPLNGWACALKICHDGMLEDTNSLASAHM